MEKEIVKIESGSLLVNKEVSKKIADFKKKAIEVDLMEKQLKEDILNLMEETGKTTYEDDYLQIVYKKASSRETLNTKLLKTDLPEIYETYKRVSSVKSSVSINVK